MGKEDIAQSEAMAEADELLQRALEETGASDPRGSYRILLRELKGRNEEAYRSAVSRFEDEVLPAILQGSVPPLVAWVEYGRHLAESLDPGRDVVIDGSGKASPFVPPPSWEDLILHLPDEPRSKAVVLGAPQRLTSAQRATTDLLAHGRLRMEA